MRQAQVAARRAPIGTPGLDRVLIIEDTRTYQATMSAMVRALGARVEIVENGADGLAALTDSGIDLAIVDQGLPDMRGGAVIAAFADGPAALLAVSGEFDASAAPAADAFASKPFDGLAGFSAAIGDAMAARDTRRSIDIERLRRGLGAKVGSAAARARRDLLRGALRIEAAALKGDEAARDDAARMLVAVAALVDAAPLASSLRALPEAVDPEAAARRIRLMCNAAARALAALAPN
jgi:two-component system NtrC family response regulator